MNKTSLPQTQDTARKSSAPLLNAVKKTGRYLLLTGLLGGCWAPNIKAPAAKLNNLRSVLIVAVESPPLEILPDPIEKRIPAYEHYTNMAMPVDLEAKLYRNTGGVVIAGQLGPDENYDAPYSAGPMSAPADVAHDWTPSHAVAQLAQNQLSTGPINAIVHSDDHPLPMTTEQRNPQLNHWHQAIQDWYAQENTSSDYARFGKFDAVLEIGVANYRIFAGQTSLQVLLKLIDPTTRRVIARARADDFDVDDAALNSLNTDSQAFKRRIAGLGTRLLTHALNDIGWHSSSATLAVTGQ